MIAKIEGKRIKIYKSDGTIIRHIVCREFVASAYVNGEEVNVQFCNGGGAIYNINGMIIRYIHS